MVQRPFQRLAIVNRGEPAMRVIHAVRELNEQRPNQITLIALCTEAERQALFVRKADEAYCIGPATFRDETGAPKSGYLDYEALERALVAVKADAVWVGWGFVAERPDFVDLCERLGIVFVGPSADVMRRLGDKIESKLLAEEAGVPVAPWSGGPVETVEDALRHGTEIGFPLMIKAAAGGGGRGIRRVNAPDELPTAFEHARAEAAESFGDGTVLMEKALTPARHIEVQVIGDGQGAAWAVGVRDCTYQRRHQKVVEESSSPALDPVQERELCDAAVRLALLAGYQNAGTVEFLYQPDERRFSFMEVNARLQVEHPVTEMVTGLDLVKMQLDIAFGRRLHGEPPQPSGHAVEMRLNAEDPALGFAPAPGRIELLQLPTGPGVRVDTGFAQGDEIPVEFDSMIAKILAWGDTRDEALARLRRALSETMVLVDGGTTNQGFLLELLNRPELRSGRVDTTWLDRLHLAGDIESVRYADAALVQAAIELANAEAAIERSQFYGYARRGRPQARAELGRTVELRHRGRRYAFRVWQIGPQRYRLIVDGTTIEADAERLSEHERRLTYGYHVYRTVTSLQGTQLVVEVNGVPHRIIRDEGGLVRSIAPAVVVSIPVSVGDEVAAGDVVAVVESMKMETSLTTPVAGRVRNVLVNANMQVGAQAPLVQIEPIEGEGEAVATDGEHVAFRELLDDLSDDPAGRCHANLERLGWLMLGYDITDGEVQAILADMHGVCSDRMACDPALIPAEHRLLELFADLRALTRPRHGEEDEAASETELLRSPQEYLHAYLRSLDAAAEGLPEGFVALLERALAHYGIEGVERTPALEDACFRIFLSHDRVQSARQAVLSILDQRLENAGAMAGHVGPDFRDALDRLLAAMEGRDQVIADLAREVRYRYYDEPLIRAARERIYAEMEDQLAALEQDPLCADRAERIAAIVECPQVMAPILTARIPDASPAYRSVLEEAMSRRYYRVRILDDFEETSVDGYTFLTTRYDFFGTARRLVAGYVELDELTAATSAFSRYAATLPDGQDAVADFYAVHSDGAPPHAEMAASLRAALEQAELPPNLHRIVLAVSEPRRGRGISAVDFFTFRPDGEGGLREDETMRGIHPMMSQRLQLWRLSNFALERQPSAEDVYFFHGVARTNPKDERLFALAEVRDLTPQRDELGRVTSLPQLERMLVEATEAIREYQAHRMLRERLHWNRVLLHVWPVIDLAPEEVRKLVDRAAPASAGLGIEMLLVRGRIREPDGSVRDRVMRFFSPTGRGVVVEVDDPPDDPLQPLDEAAQRIVAARRRGTLHPAEVVKLMAPAHHDAAAAHQPVGDFVEYDLDAEDRLVPVDRPPAMNKAGIVVGVIRNYTERYPEGMRRVALFGDPTRALGALAEPECKRINKAIDLAQELEVPLEWFAISAGAKIAMDSGTENMDWIAAVLRRIIDFTQDGGEINVVVTGINVGAQPYWNAEATMLMHTRGILVMTPDSAMVLTGKTSLDYSGGVSAEDNFGIGGYERVMGPNGQAQYWAPDLASACRVLLSYYDHSYVAPGERFPRRAKTDDPATRDVRPEPHWAPGSDLVRVGDIFSDATNPGRKKAFDIRSVMRATIDADHPPLERWAGMRDAEIAVVWDAHLGGWPVSVLGFESRPLQRYGPLPADGPEVWTSGTLFPRSSKKIARAINAASGTRPLVVLANLAGFDGSPESMSEWQLEYGAEIGRAVVNFDGPIVFCVVSRYHGGAFVVFSQKLNDQMETIALQGTHSSVIGGAPAAGVVFAREVDVNTRRDPRIAELDEAIAAAQGTERQRLRAARAALWPEVRSEKLGELAAQFDAVHSVERAVRMGSVKEIIAPELLRPYLIEALDRGIERTLARAAADNGAGRVAARAAR